MFQTAKYLCLTFSIILFAGCGDAGPQIVEVEGTVMMDGKPLEKVRVEFWPEKEGMQSTALTDDQGKFVMLTPDGVTKGVVIGKHKIVLRDLSIIKSPFLGRAGEDVDMTGGQKPRIAAKYTNPTLTDLQIDITAEKKDVKFEAEPLVPKKKK